jgi:hypothetical protein
MTQERMAIGALAHTVDVFDMRRTQRPEDEQALLPRTSESESAVDLMWLSSPSQGPFAGFRSKESSVQHLKLVRCSMPAAELQQTGSRTCQRLVQLILRFSIL